MTIKLVATDMDGTFLTDEKQFDHERFQKIYNYMQANNITFVSASCNQYYQLKDFFKDFPEILFAAENGSLIASHQEIFKTDIFSAELVQKALNVLQEIPGLQIIVCGVKSAYILDNETPEFYQTSSFYFPKIKKISEFKQIDDDILKFTLNCPKDETELYMDKIAQAVGSEVSVVSSGPGDIDVIQGDINKATGLAYLAQKLNIQPEEMCAFGDGGNDLEMLSYVGHGVAMKNAAPKVHDITIFETIDNNQQGVLYHLEELFELN